MPMPDRTSDPAGDLCDLTAGRLAALIRGRAVSAREVMQSHLARYDRINPQVNAIVTCVPEAALEAADAADAALAAGRGVGPLHGLPVAHKDLFVTAGIRTTFGSRVFEHHVPDETALIVERERRAGAITLGKTNTPELGAGSQTFNEVFGATRNPYGLTKTCGGSSGGAAVALATGMTPIADGSDFGGSLRNPASFCNVVGFRPSSGRVPRWPSAAPWFSFHVHGPMARTVADVALLFDAIAGPDPRAPLSLTVPPAATSRALERDPAGVRIGWSPDLGALPVAPEVRAVLDGGRAALESLGCVTEESAPDLDGAHEVFTTWRAWYFDLAFGPILDAHPGMLKDTVGLEHRGGPRPGRNRRSPRRNAGAPPSIAASRAWFAEHDFLALTVAQVAPFDVAQPYVTEIAGETLPTYLDWMKSCYLISATGHPAISVPCGFTPDGLSGGGCRSSGAPTTIWGCCSSPTPSSRPPGAGDAGRRFWRRSDRAALARPPPRPALRAIPPPLGAALPLHC